MKIVFSLALVLLMGCKFRKDGALQSTPQVVRNSISTREFFGKNEPSWTGRLIMPKANERRPDGGVWFEVYEGSAGQTFPKPIWLTWNPNNKNMKELYDRTVTDITISAEDLKTSVQSGDMRPERLNGLKKVSFLESLAGARTPAHAENIAGIQTADSMEVFIPKASLSGDKLLIDEEPAQIVGKKVMLLKFVKKSGELAYEAQPWTSGGFSSQTIQITYQKPSRDPKTVSWQPTIEGIERINANRDGWYAFGDDVNGKFQVRAIEPRAAMMLNRAIPFSDGIKYIDKDNFKDTRTQKGTITTAVIQKNGNFAAPKPGTRGIFTHVFGGIDGTDGDKPITIPATPVKFYTGHFAFGVAEVMTDPFTGQPRLDLEYRQVYANNIQSITSGANKWHSFSGSLRRGWMYSRAISDSVIWHPALNRSFQIGGESFSPLDGILHELSVMAARFRSGDGAGSAKVTSITSCVQDSNQAVFISFNRFMNWTNSSAQVKSLIAAKKTNPDGRHLSELKDIAAEYHSRIIGLAALRYKWVEAGRKASGEEPELVVQRESANAFGSIISAIASRKFLTPDWANKDILKLFYERGATLWFVRTNQVGGIKPGIVPTAPGFD